MDQEMLLDGLKAMVLGMVAVYAFLVIMIILTSVLSKVLAPYAHLLDKPVQPAKRKSSASASGAGKNLSSSDMVLAQAAVQAVKMFRGAK